MPQLSRNATQAGHNLPIQNKAAANPRAQNQPENIPVPLCRTKPRLCQSKAISIIPNANGAVSVPAELFS